MKQCIIFTNEDIRDLIEGREIKLRINDREVLYFMSKERYSKLYRNNNVTKDEPNEQIVDSLGKITNALRIAWEYSQIDGSHHKAWCIDQMVRALCGDDKTYKAWIKLYTKPFVDDSGDLDSYSWDEGIAP